jgi:hypothetical protein
MMQLLDYAIGVGQKEEYHPYKLVCVFDTLMVI